jgi:hypothetical protein
VKARETGPTFLRIRWDVVSEDDGRLVIKEATLCKPHLGTDRPQVPELPRLRAVGSSLRILRGPQTGQDFGHRHHQHSTCNQWATLGDAVAPLRPVGRKPQRRRERVWVSAALTPYVWDLHCSGLGTPPVEAFRLAAEQHVPVGRAHGPCAGAYAFPS